MTVAPNSRYTQAATESVTCHLYDEFSRPLLERENNVYRYREVFRSATYLMTALPLPPPPPMEYYAKDTESMQFLAYKFLKDPTLWWQIAEANPQIWYPLDLKPGAYMRMPG